MTKKQIQILENEVEELKKRITKNEEEIKELKKQYGLLFKK